MLKKGRCMYVTKCSLFNCGLLFCRCFSMFYCMFLYFGWEAMTPSTTPPICHLVNELAYTKAPRPSFMHWSPSHLITSVPMLAPHTLQTIYKTGPSGIKTELNVKTAVISASVVYQQPLFLALSSVLFFNCLTKASFSLIRALTSDENPPKDCLCLHSGLRNYLWVKLSKCVNYDINVHCSNWNPMAQCVLFFILVFWCFNPRSWTAAGTFQWK